jgi:hypothetical protein
MADPNLPQGSATPNARQMEQGDDLSKQELVERFGALLQQVCRLLAALIGADTTAVLLRSALLQARRTYPVLHDLEMDAAGGHTELRLANLDNLDNIELHDSLLAYIDAIIALITDLTGEILAQKIAPLVQQFHTSP